MARYSLNLPDELKSKAEAFAKHQGISLNQFIMWSVAEKVGQMTVSKTPSRPKPPKEFQAIDFRLGSAGVYRPVLKSSGIHIKTIVNCATIWKQSPEEIASEYDNLQVSEVEEALSYYCSHREEIDLDMVIDDLLADTSASRMVSVG